MAQEENEKKIQQQQEGAQTYSTRTTTEQVEPSSVNLDRVNELYKKAEGIDLSEQSISKAPSILAMTQLGKKTTDNYLEQQKRNQRAGKFAAWSQFANALAAYAGGAFNGQAMPLQQNYNLPMTSFQKADAYRDAMAQNEEKYASAKISAMQNEKAKRMQEKNMYMEAAQKELDNAYKYGNKVKTEALNKTEKMDEIDKMDKLAGIDLKKARTRYYNRKSSESPKGSTAGEFTPLVQFPEYSPDGTMYPEWLAKKRLYDDQVPTVIHRLESYLKSAQKKEDEGKSQFLTDIEKALLTTDNITDYLNLQLDTSELRRDRINFIYKMIVTDPELFKDIITDESASKRKSTNGSASGGSSSDEVGDIDEF